MIPQFSAPTGISVAPGTPSVVGTEITFPATSSGSLVGALYGVEVGIGVGAGYVWSESVAGAASSQTITIDIATYGGTTSSVVNAREYYNLDLGDDPSTRVYSAMLAPIVVSASLSGTTTEGETLTGANGIIVGGYQMTLTQSWAACNTAGTSCTPISGQTATTLVLSASEVGDTIKYTKTATNTAGSGSATSNASAVVASASSPVVYDNFSTSSQVSDTVNSWTHTPTGTPTKVFVGITWFNSADSISSVTYGGVAMSLVQTVTNGATEVAAIYGLLSPSAGAQTVTVTWGSTAVSRCGAVSVTGGDTTTLVRGTSATNTGSSTTPSVVQTSDAVDLVFAIMAADDSNSSPISPGASVDERWDLAAFTALASWGVTKAGAASVTVNGTLSNFNAWGIAACSIKGL